MKQPPFTNLWIVRLTGITALLFGVFTPAHATGIPDLVVTGYALSVLRPEAGQTFSIDIDVKNLGTADTVGAFYRSVYVDRDVTDTNFYHLDFDGANTGCLFNNVAGEIDDGDFKVQENFANGVAVGATDTQTVTISGGLLPGLHQLWLYTDPTCQIAESIENNNAYGPITINITPFPSASSRWTSSFDLSHGWTVADYVRTVGDVDGDGRDDLIGFGLDGVYVALSTGSGFGPVSRWTTSFDLSHGWTVASYVRTVGDVNNDGQADLIGFGLDGVYVALSTGSGFGPVSRWTTSFDLSHGWTVADYVRTVGDVNNDGRTDLIGFGLDGVYVALSNGTSFDAISKWTSSFDLSHGWTVASYIRTVGDVNNDGRDDLIGFGLDGVYIALSTGSAFGPIGKWSSSFDLSHGWTVADYVRTVGDVNGDGNVDLVGFGLDGVYGALSTGSGFGDISRWTIAFDLSHGWTVSQYARTLGDVNGDGRTDLVGFGQDGVYISLAQ